jgi:hypothetical protein
VNAAANANITFKALLNEVASLHVDVHVDVYDEAKLALQSSVVQKLPVLT